MTREWRSWQADPDQITALEKCEREMRVQLKVQEALVKARLYGGAVIIIGVDAGNPQDELNLDDVKQDSLQFLHVVSRNQLSVGPIIYDITSKYFGQPEWYMPTTIMTSYSAPGKSQVLTPEQKAYQSQPRVHPSRVVRFIGADTADQMLSNIWGDSILQTINDAVKSSGLVSGSLATLIAEMKVDIISVPELKSILSTDAGTNKMIGRFSAANAAKSVINTVLIDANEKWQRVTQSLAGVPEVLVAYLQIVSGAVDIPAGRFLGIPHRGLNVTGEADFRNYYDRLASEQKVTLTPAMTSLDEVLIRSVLGNRPDDCTYKWRSL
jgi:phage-related protein (TIGR01555 family)